MQELDFTSPDAWTSGPCFGAFILADEKAGLITLRDVLRKADFCEELDARLLPEELRHPHFTRWIFSKPDRWPGPVGFALIDPSGKDDYHVLWTYPQQVKYACNLPEEGWLWPSVTAPTAEAVEFVAGLAEIVIELSRMTRLRSVILISEEDCPRPGFLADRTCHAYSWINSELEGASLSKNGLFVSIPLAGH